MRLTSPTLAALLAAGLVFLLPGLQPLLIYDREAILGGEVWRLFTGHWVHFSARHLGCNLVVFGIAGMIVESRHDPRWRWLLALAPWLIGLGLLGAEPRMSSYGGLSGVATAAVVYLALSGVKESPPWLERRASPSATKQNWLWWGTLLLVALKMILEWATGQALFVGAGREQFVSAPLSHLLGGLSATLVWLLPGKQALRTTIFRSRSEYQSPPPKSEAANISASSRE